MLIFIMGTSIACLNISNNTLLAYIFVAKLRFHRNNQLFYLFCLAVCDIITAVAYLLLFSVAVYAEFTGDLVIHVLWHQYVRCGGDVA